MPACHFVLRFLFLIGLIADQFYFLPSIIDTCMYIFNISVVFNWKTDKQTAVTTAFAYMYIYRNQEIEVTDMSAHGRLTFSL